MADSRSSIYKNAKFWNVQRVIICVILKNFAAIYYNVNRETSVYGHAIRIGL